MRISKLRIGVHAFVQAPTSMEPGNFSALLRRVENGFKLIYKLV